MAAKRSPNKAYDNNAYASVEQDVQVRGNNRTFSSDKKTVEEHQLNVITHRALVSEGFQDAEEPVQKVNREKPTASIKCETNEGPSGSTDCRSQEASKEIKQYDSKL